MYMITPFVQLNMWKFQLIRTGAAKLGEIRGRFPLQDDLSVSEGASSAINSAKLSQLACMIRWSLFDVFHSKREWHGRKLMKSWPSFCFVALFWTFVVLQSETMSSINFQTFFSYDDIRGTVERLTACHIWGPAGFNSRSDPFLMWFFDCVGLLWRSLIRPPPFSCPFLFTTRGAHPLKHGPLFQTWNFS
jgi:hypothetical protein